MPAATKCNLLLSHVTSFNASFPFVKNRPVFFVQLAHTSHPTLTRSSFHQIFNFVSEKVQSPQLNQQFQRLYISNASQLHIFHTYPFFSDNSTQNEKAFHSLWDRLIFFAVEANSFMQSELNTYHYAGKMGNKYEIALSPKFFSPQITHIHYEL